MDLTTATPVEIDTVLKGLYIESLEIGHRINMAADALHYKAGDKRRYVYTGNSNRTRQEWGMSLTECIEAVTSLTQSDRTYLAREAERTLATYNAAVSDLNANKAAQAEHHAEFYRRGGWTRAFLAVGTGELHVHSSMDCSTCNNGFEPTRFDWRTEFSGGTEADVVEAAGERACTVCYPSAPAETLRRASTIFSPEEVAKAAAREERAAKKAAADALKVIVPDMPTRKIRPERIEADVKEFKTLRAALQAAVDARYDALRTAGWEPNPRFIQPNPADVAEAIERAIAAKTGRTVEDVKAETTAKAEKKMAKDW